MSDAPYDAIAEWYDAYLREKPLYSEIVLPGMLDLVGDAAGQVVCDLACGQGFIARELARRGAQVTGVDLSAKMLAIARRYEERAPLGIRYLQTDAQQAPTLDDGAFGGATCSMALMPIPDLGAALRTARRILKPGGWLVFAITHPCYQTPHSQWVRRVDGRWAREVSGYFAECYWTSTNPSGVRGQVGEYHRTLSTYLNTLIASGFALEQMTEPRGGGRLAEEIPGTVETPSILLLRARAV